MKHLNRFISYSDDWKCGWGIELESGDDEIQWPSLHLKLLNKYFVVIRLPQWVLQPYKVKTKATYWTDEDIARMGQDWYWEYIRRRYGFYINDGHFHMSFGRDTHDSSTTDSWGCFVPWLTWRFSRHSYYNLDHSLFGNQPFKRSTRRWFVWCSDYDAGHAIEEKVPKAVIRFKDFDGEANEATVFIEEREWKFGEAWCSWLSWFRKPMIRRVLDISYKTEVGGEKGSWKGGVVGESCEILPGEDIMVAFQRHMDNNQAGRNFRRFTEIERIS